MTLVSRSIPGTAPLEQQVEVLFPLLLTPWEKYFLVDDRPDYPMTFMIHFQLAGCLDRELFGEALRVILARHPLLMSTVTARSSARWEWSLRPDLEPALQWMPSSHELPGDGARLPLNPFKEPGFSMTVRAAADRTEITALFHHACTDGIGAMGMLGELFHEYVRRSDVEPQNLQLIHPTRAASLANRRPVSTDRLGALRGFTRWKRRGSLAVRDAITSAEILLRTPTALASSHAETISADPLVFPGIVRTSTTKEACRRLRRAGRKRDVSFHTVLAAGLFKTLSDWNLKMQPRRPGRYLRLLLPANLRLPEQLDLPAANCMSYAFATRPTRRCTSMDRILRGLHEELDPVWRERRATLFLDVLQMFAPFPRLMRFVSRRSLRYATAALSYLGSPSALMNIEHESTAEGYPRVGSLALTEVRATPPLRPGMRASFSAWTHDGILHLAVRCDPRHFSRHDAGQLLEKYCQNLEEFAGQFC